MRGISKFVIILILAAFLIIGIAYYFSQRSSQNESAPTNVSTQTKVGEKNMTLTSSVFTNNQNIPVKYTCDGDDINPPLDILNIPQNAKSLTLIVDDPDAPGGTWVHWLVFNINPKTSQIPENSVPPEAREGTTSFGKPSYGGPCPPNGTHHYYFKLYALDTLLNFDSSAKKQDLENAIQGHIIEQTELIGLYKR